MGMFFTSGASSQSVRVSTTGYNNPSESFKYAMVSSYDTVIVGVESSPLYLPPLSFKGLKGKVLLLEEGVEVLARYGSFPETNDALLTFTDCINLEIIGNGAKLCMNKQEYTSGEWRHGISLRGCEKFKISNLQISDTGGDGIYIAGSQKKPYSEGIIVDAVRSYNNKRQGISIISAIDVLLTDCFFMETKGTLPGAGLDIEPNQEKDVIYKIIVKDCKFQNNYGPGILISLGKLKRTSRDVLINFENCLLKNNFSSKNKGAAAEIVIQANKNSPVYGHVNFTECTATDSNWGLLYSRKRADAFAVSFDSCTVRKTSKNGISPTIYLEVPDYRQHTGPLGGFLFRDLYINNNNSLPFMIVRGSKLGTLSKLKQITGNIIMSNDIDDPIEYINYFPVFNENVKLNFIKK